MLSAAALRDLWKSHRRELRQITPKVELRKNKYQPVIDHFRAEYYKDLDAEGGSQAVSLSNYLFISLHLYIVLIYKYLFIYFIRILLV